MEVYLIPIKYAMFIFPFLAGLITIPFMINQYNKYGSIHKLRVLIIYSFVLYLLTAYFLVILPLPTFESVKNLDIAQYQLNFMASIKELIVSYNWHDFNILTLVKNPIFYTTAYNILLTVPFGIYLRYYFQKSFIKTLFYSFTLTLFFELTQLTGLYFIYPRNYRLFDVDDLFFNTLGGVIGYLITPLFSRFLPSRAEIDSESYEMGQEISFLRRLLAFCIDLFIYLAFIVVIVISYYQKIFSFSIGILIVLFSLFYYLIIPFISKGYTIGKRLVNIRIVTVKNEKYIRFKIIARNFILYFIYLPAIFYLCLINNFYQLSNYIFISTVLIISICYILSFIGLLTKDRLFYEKITDTQNKSQIKYLPTIDKCAKINDMEGEEE